MSLKNLLKEFLHLFVVSEAYDTKNRVWFDPKTGEALPTKEEEMELQRLEDKKKIKRDASHEFNRARVDKEFDKSVVEMMNEPEYEGLSSFIDYKADDEQTEFSTNELQAVARNMFAAISGQKNVIAPDEFVNKLRTELESYGLKYVPRLKTKDYRGAFANKHGRSKYADIVGGGSGQSSGGIGLGTGPGAIGGKYAWDPNDPKNLGMVKSKDIAKDAPRNWAPPSKEEKELAKKTDQDREAEQKAKLPSRPRTPIRPAVDYVIRRKKKTEE